MPINILMPALSPTMTEGTLAKWLVKEGDEISSGDVIAEIETDKATMEVEAVDEGTVGKIMVAEGTDGVPVNKVIAVLLEEGEDASAISEAPEAPTPQPTQAEAAKPASSGNGATPPTTVNPQVTDAVTRAASPAPAAPSGPGGRIFASPLARRIAKDKGVDLAALKGSGPHGRIVKADVEGAQPGAAAPAATAAAAATPAAAAAAPQATGPGAKQLADMLGMAYTQEPLSGMRKTIAKRLTESKQQVPHFYLTVDCELDELLKVRKELNSRSDAYKISVNDFIIRAVALALKQVPAANASYDESGLLFYAHADVSVAVATPSGLITPIIKAAEGKGLATIANEMKDLAGRARKKKLAPHEYQGGSTAVSNLGMFGVKDFAAVINPPHATILAIGAGEKRAVVKDDAIAIAQVMTVTLSTDHRCVDGALGAELLAAFKGYIENPMSMLV